MACIAKRRGRYVLDYYGNQQWYPTKTKASNRRIDLGPSRMAELKKWKLACPPNKQTLIFPNEAGGPINHNNLVARYFEPALEEWSQNGHNLIKN